MLESIYTFIGSKGEIFMNISGLLNSSISTSTTRFMDCTKRAGASSFRNLLSDAQQTNQGTIHLYLPRENTIYSGGTGYQTVYAEYTADSTAEDPIVRIRGQASSGEYDFICHINDINPEQASYAELCALWGHLQKTGEISFQFGGKDRPVIPYGVDTGDIMRRQDYMSKISGMTTSRMFDQSNQISAKNLLDVYQNFINANQRESGNPGTGMEGLADAVVLTDPMENPTLRAAYDQLSPSSKGILNRMKAGQADITQDEWTSLCRELKDAGMMTESDFAYARADLRIVPLGFMDGKAFNVTQNPASLISPLGGRDEPKWMGDPLAFFDQWIEAMYKWRSDLAAARSPDGSRQFQDLSSVTRCIGSCQKVENLVRNLMTFNGN